MDDVQLNLARKWRSKTFDEIIGQDLAVRLAKNSLYRGQFFPVYLLYGQRGCGKTTMGRVFAAAVNCDQLHAFQQQPQSALLPCLNCSSCHAMRSGNHPDFIEIDAASYTGVDNVRSIIESASYLPVLGRKKIYLIDEAHMLSKAAFNAFLKILEDPPRTTLFMLATTDNHKIIDTVRSRCFQLFFQPVAQKDLIEYLADIAKKENIKAHRDGLTLIAQEAEGSVRDALNLIERVRLVHDTITQETVASILGTVGDEQLLACFTLVCQANVTAVMAEVQRWQQHGYQARSLWRRLIELIRACFFVYHKVELLPYEPFAAYRTSMQKSIAHLSAHTMIRLWELCYEIEPVMTKTTSQQGMLELLLLKMCQLCSAAEPLKPQAATTISENVPVLSTVENKKTMWGQFLTTLDNLNDPLVSSMFKQAQLIRWDTVGTVEVSFPAQFVFFKEMLTNTEPIWKAAMHNIAQCPITFIARFRERGDEDNKSSVDGVGKQPPAQALGSMKKPTNNVVDVRDADNYPQAHLLLKSFPGTIYEKTGY